MLSFVLYGFDDMSLWTPLIVGTGTVTERLAGSFKGNCPIDGDIAGLVTVSPQDLSESDIKILANRNTGKTAILLRLDQLTASDPMAIDSRAVYAFMRDNRYGVIIQSGGGYPFRQVDSVDPSLSAEMRVVVSGGIIHFYYEGVEIYSEAHGRLGDATAVYAYLASHATSYGDPFPGTNTFMSPTVLHPVNINAYNRIMVPIEGFSFNLTKEGIPTSYVIPWSGSLEEVPYQIEMPSNVSIGSSTYNFAEYQDELANVIGTNPILSFTPIAPTTINAVFEVVLRTAIQVHAFVDSVQVDADGLIVETGGTFRTGSTGITLDVLPGTYTVRVTYPKRLPYEEQVTVEENQTIRVDAQLVSPTPIPPLAIILVAAVPVAIILWWLLK